MKTWNEVFTFFCCALLLCTFTFVFLLKTLLNDMTPLEALMAAVIPYVVFVAMAFWVNRIVKKKDREIETLKNAQSNLNNLLAQQPLIPANACFMLMNIIGLLGEKWWNNFGRDTLSKLFYDRKSNESDKIDYIGHFLWEAALSGKYQEKASIMLPTIFSVITIGELAKIMANTYYNYAVNLLGGKVTTLAENLTLVVKNNSQIPDSLLPEVAKYAKEIVAEKKDGDEGQKILGIIEGEIAKVWK